MLAIVTGETAVALFLGQILNPRTLIVVGKVDRLGPCVRRAEQRAGPATREQRLKSVVRSCPVGLDRVDIRLETEPRKERRTSRSGSRRACVDVDESHLIDCARANISDLTHKLPWQLTFDDEVERVNFLAPRFFTRSTSSSNVSCHGSL